jgi:predicted transcriptional regulator
MEMAGRKPGTISLTPLELKIMQVLWSQGPSNVLEVQESLTSGESLAYNTVQTMLNILQRKGRVRRTLKGRSYVYRPAVSREKVLSQAVQDIVERMFGGSSEELVMNLIKSRQIDLAKLGDLSRKMVAQESGEDDE